MKGTEKQKNADRYRLSYSSETDSLPKRALIGAIEMATGRRKLERLYTEVRNEKPEAAEIWSTVLNKLDISLQYDEQRLAKIPESGPLIFIANHPFGVVDGLAFGHIVSRVRTDFFVLVNEVLCREPLLAPYLLPIDFRETKEALQTNIETRRKTIERLQQGDAMAIFPAGGVATAPRMFGQAEDLDWKRFVVKMIRQTKATIVPIYFHGQNSPMFHLASKISMNLRLGFLLNEIRNKMGKELLISIGDPLPYSAIEHIKDRQEMLNKLRTITFDLKDNF